MSLSLQGSPSLARGPSLEAGSESAQAPGNVAPEDEDPQDAEGVTEDSLEHRQERLHDVVRSLQHIMHVVHCRRTFQGLSLLHHRCLLLLLKGMVQGY